VPRQSPRPCRASFLRALAPAAATFLSFCIIQTAIPSCSKGDGSIDGSVTVESQIRGDFVLFSFDSNDLLRDSWGAPVVTGEPSSESGWDFAISQWVLATPSGSSSWDGSSSRGALLAVEGAVDGWPDLESFSAHCSDFAAAGETQNGGSLGCNRGTPTVDSGYVADSVDDPDGAGPFPELSYNPSLTFWFEYEFSSHEVHPYGNVYVVEAADGRCVKLQVTDYYDESGESGFVSFSWDWLPD
jgi:hypothetical protein